MLDILKDGGLLTAKSSHIPMEQRHKLSKETGIPLREPTMYRRLIGRLIYLTTTSSNITYSVQVLNQFLECPSDLHMKAAFKLRRYIKVALELGILLSSRSDLKLKA